MTLSVDAPKKPLLNSAPPAAAGARSGSSGSHGSGSDPGLRQIIRDGGGLYWALTVAGVFVGLVILWRAWQMAFAWKYGLDAAAPEFTQYWISMLIFNLAGLSLVGGGAALYLARGCKKCAHQRGEFGDVAPKHEAEHIWRLWAISCGFAVSFFAFTFFAEQDAAWHQVTVRDTAFTPSHIPLFFGMAPFAVVTAACIYVYASTRVPKVYAKGVPATLATFLAGIFLLFVWVGFNEWGHSFWIAEELFSAPLHWGFVFMAFFAFALLGMFLQTIRRLDEIRRQEALNSEAANGPVSDDADGTSDERELTGTVRQ